MSTKKFTDMSDAEIWEDFTDTEYKGTAMNRLLREIVHGGECDCCKYIGTKKKRPTITFQDGTKYYIQFCPRCGKAL